VPSPLKGEKLFTTIFCNLKTLPLLGEVLRRREGVYHPSRGSTPQEGRGLSPF